jgi:hypothetical protein
MMQRRTDLWGPDGKFVRTDKPIDLCSNFPQLRNLILIAGLTNASTHTSPKIRLFSSRSMLAHEFA